MGRPSQATESKGSQAAGGSGLKASERMRGHQRSPESQEGIGELPSPSPREGHRHVSTKLHGSPLRQHKAHLSWVW